MKEKATRQYPLTWTSVNSLRVEGEAEGKDEGEDEGEGEGEGEGESSRVR
jgi:hypothetical protein